MFDVDSILGSAELPQDVVDRLTAIIDRLLFTTDRFGKKATRIEDGHLVPSAWELINHDCSRYVHALSSETDPGRRAHMMRSELSGRVRRIAGALYWHEAERFRKHRAAELAIELKELRTTYADAPENSPVRLLLVKLATLIRQNDGTLLHDQSVSRQMARANPDLIYRHVEALRTMYEIAAQGTGDISYVHFDVPAIELSTGDESALEMSAALIAARSAQRHMDMAISAHHQAKGQLNPPQFASRMEAALRAEARGDVFLERHQRFAEIQRQQADAEAAFLMANAAMYGRHEVLQKAVARLKAALASETDANTRASFESGGWGLNEIGATSAKRMVNCVAARHCLHKAGESEERFNKAKFEINTRFTNFDGRDPPTFDAFAYVDAVLSHTTSEGLT